MTHNWENHRTLKAPHSYPLNDQGFFGQVLCILVDFAFGK